MSRGAGSMQNAILRLLQSTGEDMTIETTRWSLYENTGKSATIGMLPSAWNTSVSRAAKGLHERGLVEITPRHLVSFEECVRHYPGKAMQAEKRALRDRFLPLLWNWTQEARGISPKYGEAANEKFHLEHLPKSVVEELGRRWCSLEDALRPIYGQASESADLLLDLICKGSSLFRRSGIETYPSLTDAIESVCRRNLVPSHLCTELQAFKQDFLSNQQAGSLRLKSFVHEIADVPKHGQCALKAATLNYLHENDREFVEKMPGFKKKESQFHTYFGQELDPSKRFEYPPDLVALFDQTVFQRFKFITLAA